MNKEEFLSQMAEMVNAYAKHCTDERLSEDYHFKYVVLISLMYLIANQEDEESED